MNQIDLEVLIERYRKKWATNTVYVLIGFSLSRFHGFLWLLPGFKWLAFAMVLAWLIWIVIAHLTIWMDVNQGRDWDEHINPDHYFAGIAIGLLMLSGIGIELYRVSP